MLCSLSCADLVLIKAQNTVNPFGLTSILTKSKGKFAPDQFIDKEKIEKWYDGDYHNIYYGAIEKVLIKK